MKRTKQHYVDGSVVENEHQTMKEEQSTDIKTTLRRICNPRLSWDLELKKLQSLEGWRNELMCQLTEMMKQEVNVTNKNKSTQDMMTEKTCKLQPSWDLLLGQSTYI